MIQLIKISIMVVLLFIGNNPLWAQNNNGFTKLTTKDGLSQNSIEILLQDSKGFMWIGTPNGLNRFDGYSFIVYQSDEQNTNTISHNFIEAIIEDSKGNLWIGTNNGLNKFNPQNQTFTRYLHFNEGTTSLGIGVIKSLYLDSKNRLWIGTRNNGLLMMNLETEKLEVFNDFIPNNNTIFSICEDKKGAIWIYNNYGVDKLIEETKTFITYKTVYSNPDVKQKLFKDKNGDLWFGEYEWRLWKYNYELDEFEQLKFDYQEFNSLPGERLITSITEDDKGYLWLGTWSSGIFKLDKKTGEYQHYNTNPDDPKSLSYSHCWQVFIDDANLLWVGTEGQGINKLVLNDNGIQVYKRGLRRQEGLIANMVKGIYEDDRGILWVGTYGGFNKINRKTGEIKHFPYGPNTLNSAVLTMIPDLHHSNELWLGTHVLGLYKINILTDQIVHKLPPNGKANLIFSMVQDASGNLWLGGHSGLYVYNPKTDQYKLILGSNAPTYQIDTPIINQLYLDDSTLWIGTRNKGLIKYNIITAEQKRYNIYTEDSNSGVPASIESIHKAKNGTLWLGTEAKGLNKFITETEQFISYTEHDGLPNNTVLGILEDDHENLWLSTYNGIAKFNPTTKTVRTFTIADGLQDIEFNRGAFFKSNSGEFFFGGKDGLNCFYPNKLTFNSTIPKIAITSLKSYGRPITFLNKMNNTNAVELNYEQDELEFEFSSLSYAETNLNQYAYKLEGVDKDWVYTGNRRFVTYTNLAPGQYIFKVKGTNSHGIWNEKGVSLPIKITPPFWSTIWFKTLCFIFFIGLICYITFRVRVRQTQLKLAKDYFKSKNEEKEAIIKEIHHRIKNNLGVVNSLLKLQSREIEDKNIVAIFKEAQNRVISMALLHEKMYRSDDLQHIDVREHIQLLIEDLIKSYEVDKKIKLDLRVDKVAFEMRTLVPLGLIINEIITNSLKYAFKNKKEGMITVWLKMVNHESYQLTIGDNGIGMSIGKSNKKGMGTRLIQSFIRQLKGNIKRLELPGTMYKINFMKID